MNDAEMHIATCKVQRVESAPLRQPLPADPCAMVIFGAGGDLTTRLLLPALYNLARTNLLPEQFALIGLGLAERTTESWRADLHEALRKSIGNANGAFNIDAIDEAAWQRLSRSMSYIQGDLNDPKLYEEIGIALDEAKRNRGTAGNAIFYLAIADRFFGAVVERLGASNLTQQNLDGENMFWRRVVIEKPFGHSLESARELNGSILRTLEENQIYRIDHFLGKETVQNIMALRFANGLFEPIWNRDRIDHVQITAAETVGVEKRGKFYEATGALRDMVPNHVLSLLSLVAMEPPVSFDATSIRNKKAELLMAIRAVSPKQAVRGQYSKGSILGKQVVAYRDEEDVARDSKVETYVAMQIEVDNWRWAGVPFLVRTGKHMSSRKTEIAIRFKQAPFAPFSDTQVDNLPPNWLVLGIAPDEGVSLQFEVKRPGPVLDLTAVRMEFRYNDWFPKEPNVGYETLLHDVMIGDATLFMRADMVEQTWRIVQPVLDAWASDKAPIPSYASGSDGPEIANGLFGNDGKREWRPVTLPQELEK